MKCASCEDELCIESLYLGLCWSISVAMSLSVRFWYSVQLYVVVRKMRRAT